MKLRNPWPAGYTINAGSPYGWRKHPISGKRKFHQGVDVAGSFPVTVAANDSTTLTLGITMLATDVMTVSAGTADALSINVFGAEITV